MRLIWRAAGGDEALDVAVGANPLGEAGPTGAVARPEVGAEPELPATGAGEEPRLASGQGRGVEVGEDGLEVVVGDGDQERGGAVVSGPGDADAPQTVDERGGVDAVTDRHDRHRRGRQALLGVVGIHADLAPPTGAVGRHVALDQVAAIAQPTERVVHLGRRHLAGQCVDERVDIAVAVDEQRRQPHVGVATQHAAAPLREQEHGVVVHHLDAVPGRELHHLPGHSSNGTGLSSSSAAGAARQPSRTGTSYSRPGANRGGR